MSEAQGIARHAYAERGSCRVLAFAFCNAAFCTWYSHDPVQGLQQTDYLTHIPLMFLLFFGAFLWRDKSPLRPGWIQVCLAAGALASAGSLLSLLTAEGGSTTLLVVSVVSSALGLAALVFFLGAMLAKVEGQRLVLEIVLGYLVLIILHTVFMSIPVPCSLFLKAIFPFMGGVLLYISLRNDRGHLDGYRIPKAKDMAHVLRFVTATNIMGITLSIVYNLYAIEGYVAGIAISRMRLPMDLTMVVSSLLVVLLLSLGKFKTVYLYRMTAITSMLGFLILPIFGMFSAVPFIVNGAGYIGLCAVTWILCVKISKSINISPFVTCGIGIGAWLGLQTAPTIYIVTQALSRFEPSALFLNIVNLCGVVLTFLAYALVFTEKMILNLDRSDSPPLLANGGMPGLLQSAELQSAFAREHGITKREMEVLVLLGRGRSGTHIQNELRISRGTFNSHAASLYHKLDVHSREQLLDLIEEEDPPSAL